MRLDHHLFTEWKRSEIWFLTATSIIVLASRLPFIRLGPGTDPDSFRVFNVAKDFVEFGHYSYSRPPGYPLHELLVAAFIDFGPTGTNLLSALFSMIAFFFLALILRKFGVQSYLFGSLSFAFTPIVYLNSTVTIDYVPAITLILAASYFVLNHRFIIAAVCLGLSVGFRITSGAMLIPFIIWMFFYMGRGTFTVRSSCLLVTITLLIALMSFSPVLLTYGMDFFTFADNVGYPSLSTIWERGVIKIWGQIGVYGLILLCCTTPLYFRHIKSTLAQHKKQALILLAATTITIYILAFLRLPQESGYLIPIVPFIIVIIGLFFPPIYLRATALLLLVSSFVTLGTSGVSLTGVLFKDQQKRSGLLQSTNMLIETVNDFPKDSIVVVGPYLPLIKTQAKLQTDQNLDQYIYAVYNREICEQYLAQGKIIYYLAGLDSWNKFQFGVDLKQSCRAYQLF